MEKVYETLKISASALTAERRRMNVIANNIANINTTRGANEEPYRRQYVVFQTVMDKSLANTEPIGKGVEVTELVEDQRPFKKIYKPGHPDADGEGYVSMPNVDIVEENVDMIAASRSYEANLSVLKNTRAMIRKMIDLMSNL
ncbi:MAG: flagellar basal body rod protein FlgC [Candidatus Aureabacteria bacterium]|nr:flagellar basal body rod protein FlgC [Candidatus Auribacterota bacterium]